MKTGWKLGLTQFHKTFPPMFHKSHELPVKTISCMIQCLKYHTLLHWHSSIGLTLMKACAAHSISLFTEIVLVLYQCETIAVIFTVYLIQLWFKLLMYFKLGLLKHWARFSNPVTPNLYKLNCFSEKKKGKTTYYFLCFFSFLKTIGVSCFEYLAYSLQ